MNKILLVGTGALQATNLLSTSIGNQFNITGNSCEPNQREKKSYGTLNGHDKWDLAVDWLQMSNDNFYYTYGFNFVPKGRLFDKAKTYVANK